MNVMDSEYYKKWKPMFREEAQKIINIFADEILSIHHIGSTSVPELSGQSIIDIMLVVKDIAIIDSFNEQMAGLEYECMGEFSIKGKRCYIKGKNLRTHRVHVFQEGDRENIDRHLAVRNYLRTHFERTGQRENRKVSRLGMTAYANAKQAFLKELEREEHCF
ncbi:GrpB family protein [uncultured Brevibacillus sp.]|uniref:GrpB family protein n=1 Tax=uncultured Brevibacillus sp. TaxID=169970 RepID=UPI0025917FC8|nr:GrpB family protein [uncultured Brevibacillus sp.]